MDEAGTEGGSPPFDTPARLRRVAAGFYSAFAAAGLLANRLVTGAWMPGFLVGGDHGTSLAAGAGLALLVVGASGPLIRGWAPFRALSREMRGLLGPVDVPTAAVVAAVSAVAEEIVFRGVIQAAVSAVDPVLGYVVASLLFGLVHLGPAPRFLIWTAFAVAMGFALGAIPLFTESLWGAVLAHGVINGVNLVRIGRLEPAEPARGSGSDAVGG